MNGGQRIATKNKEHLQANENFLQSCQTTQINAEINKIKSENSTVIRIKALCEGSSYPLLVIN